MMAPPPEVPVPTTTPDVTIYKRAPDITITVIDGPPPSDQGTEVAMLKQQIGDLTTRLAVAAGKNQRVYDAFTAFGQALAAAMSESATAPITPAPAPAPAAK